MESDFDTKFIMQGDPTIPLLPLVSGENRSFSSAAAVVTLDYDVPDESCQSLAPLPPSDFPFQTLQLLDYYDATPPPPTSFFTSFTEDYSSFNHHQRCYHHQHQLVDSSFNFVPQLDQSTMSIPIYHPPTESTHQPTFDFFCSDKNLPGLHSFESANPQKRPRLDPLLTGLNVNAYTQTLDSVVESFVIHKPNNVETTTTSYSASASATAAKTPVGKKRREKLSERARRFRKLMRWGTKMNMPTLLDEACKYLRFLKAQIEVHRSMPVHSVNSYDYFNSGAGGGAYGGAYGHLGTLNRQQLLAVMLNSPAAQKWLYSQESCVFSFEQLLRLKEDVDRRKATAVQFQKQQLMFGSSF